MSTVVKSAFCTSALWLVSQWFSPLERCYLSFSDTSSHLQFLPLSFTHRLQRIHVCAPTVSAWNRCALSYHQHHSRHEPCVIVNIYIHVSGSICLSICVVWSNPMFLCPTHPCRVMWTGKSSDPQAAVGKYYAPPFVCLSLGCRISWLARACIYRFVFILLHSTSSMVKQKKLIGGQLVQTCSVQIIDVHFCNSNIHFENNLTPFCPGSCENTSKASSIHHLCLKTFFMVI